METYLLVKVDADTGIVLGINGLAPDEAGLGYLTRRKWTINDLPKCGYTFRAVIQESNTKQYPILLFAGPTTKED